MARRGCQLNAPIPAPPVSAASWQGPQRTPSHRSSSRSPGLRARYEQQHTCLGREASSGSPRWGSAESLLHAQPQGQPGFVPNPSDRDSLSYRTHTTPSSASQWEMLDLKQPRPVPFPSAPPAGRAWAGGSCALLPSQRCYISCRDLKTCRSSKQASISLRAAAQRPGVTIQPNKIFFHKFNASMSVFGNFENPCCMVYCTGKGASRVSKEGKCITVSFQMHFPMGSIEGKGWN